uniref:Myb domain-containing protein n=1 Tax=Strongyloides papillosus TaxID=174720 RepID=A0A0N5B2I5_STREA
MLPNNFPNVGVPHIGNIPPQQLRALQLLAANNASPMNTNNNMAYIQQLQQLMNQQQQNETQRLLMEQVKRHDQAAVAALRQQQQQQQQQQQIAANERLCNDMLNMISNNPALLTNPTFVNELKAFQNNPAFLQMQQQKALQEAARMQMSAGFNNQALLLAALQQQQLQQQQQQQQSQLLAQQQQQQQQAQQQQNQLLAVQQQAQASQSVGNAQAVSGLILHRRKLFDKMISDKKKQHAADSEQIERKRKDLEDKMKKTQDEIREIDEQIDTHEKNISKAKQDFIIANEKLQQLKEKIAADAALSKDDSSSGIGGKDKDVECLIDQVRKANLLRVEASRKKTLSLNQNKPIDPAPIYFDIMDYPIVKEVLKNHETFAPKLRAHIRRIRQEEHEILEAYRKEYEKNYNAWKEKVDAFENSAEKKLKDKERSIIFEKTFDTLRSLRENEERANRASKRRSYGIDNIDPAVREKAQRSAVFVPLMQLPEKVHFINRNRIVQQPILENHRKRVRYELSLWDDDEKKTFKEVIAQYPKNFAAVQLFLPKKTAQQCVYYYYLTKHTEEYKRIFIKRKNNKARKALGAPMPLQEEVDNYLTNQKRGKDKPKTLFSLSLECWLCKKKVESNEGSLTKTSINKCHHSTCGTEVGECNDAYLCEECIQLGQPNRNPRGFKKCMIGVCQNEQKKIKALKTFSNRWNELSEDEKEFFRERFKFGILITKSCSACAKKIQKDIELFFDGALDDEVKVFQKKRDFELSPFEWDDKMNEKLLKLVENYGEDWNRISQEFENKKANSYACRSNYDHLMYLKSKAEEAERKKKEEEMEKERCKKVKEFEKEQSTLASSNSGINSCITTNNLVTVVEKALPSSTSCGSITLGTPVRNSQSNSCSSSAVVTKPIVSNKISSPFSVKSFVTSTVSDNKTSESPLLQKIVHPSVPSSHQVQVSQQPQQQVTPSSTKIEEGHPTNFNINEEDAKNILANPNFAHLHPAIRQYLYSKINLPEQIIQQQSSQALYEQLIRCNNEQQKLLSLQQQLEHVRNLKVFPPTLPRQSVPLVIAHLEEQVRDQQNIVQQLKNQLAQSQLQQNYQQLQQQYLQEQRLYEQKAQEQKLIEQKAQEQKLIEQRAQEQKLIEQRAQEQKLIEQKKKITASTSCSIPGGNNVAIFEESLRKAKAQGQELFLQQQHAQQQEIQRLNTQQQHQNHQRQGSGNIEIIKFLASLTEISDFSPDQKSQITWAMDYLKGRPHVCDLLQSLFKQDSSTADNFFRGPVAFLRKIENEIEAAKQQSNVLPQQQQPQSIEANHSNNVIVESSLTPVGDLQNASESGRKRKTGLGTQMLPQINHSPSMPSDPTHLIPGTFRPKKPTTTPSIAEIPPSKPTTKSDVSQEITINVNEVQQNLINKQIDKIVRDEMTKEAPPKRKRTNLDETVTSIINDELMKDSGNDELLSTLLSPVESKKNSMPTVEEKKDETKKEDFSFLDDSFPPPRPPELIIEPPPMPPFDIGKSVSPSLIELKQPPNLLCSLSMKISIPDGLSTSNDAKPSPSGFPVPQFTPPPVDDDSSNAEMTREDLDKSDMLLMKTPMFLPSGIPSPPKPPSITTSTELQQPPPSPPPLPTTLSSSISSVNNDLPIISEIMLLSPKPPKPPVPLMLQEHHNHHSSLKCEYEDISSSSGSDEDDLSKNELSLVDIKDEMYSELLKSFPTFDMVFISDSSQEAISPQLAAGTSRSHFTVKTTIPLSTTTPHLVSAAAPPQTPATAQSSEESAVDK